MIRIFYSFLFILLLPIIIIRLLFRSHLLPEYRLRINERFGINTLPRLKSSLWIHAVSVGEVVAAEPIIRALQEQNPKRAIVVTTTTPTGSARLCTLFPEINNQNIYHCYLPYDLGFLLLPLIRKINPIGLLIMETELWPNLIHIASRTCKVVLLNARLSSGSFKGYNQADKYMLGFVKKTLNKISLIACSDKNSYQNFIALGFENGLINTGNIKFDGRVTRTISKKTAKKSWIAGSTHEGEETLILALHKQLLSNFSSLLLLAPRHPDRFSRVEGIIKESGLIYQKSSQIGRKINNIQEQTEVVLIDEMGVLIEWYGYANMAFVGGSLVPVGGHNVLEPMMQGVPVITGPYYKNFQNIVDELQKNQGIIVIDSAEALQSQLQDYMNQPERYINQTQQAQSFIKSHQGVLKKIMTALQQENIA